VKDVKIQMQEGELRASCEGMRNNVVLLCKRRYLVVISGQTEPSKIVGSRSILTSRRKPERLFRRKEKRASLHTARRTGLLDIPLTYDEKKRRKLARLRDVVTKKGAGWIATHYRKDQSRSRPSEVM